MESMVPVGPVRSATGSSFIHCPFAQRNPRSSSVRQPSSVEATSMACFVCQWMVRQLRANRYRGCRDADRQSQQLVVEGIEAFAQL